MLKDELVAASDNAVARSWYPLPARFMAHPVNVATPVLGLTVLLVQASAAPAVPVEGAMARVTAVAFPATTFPDESSMVTCGCCGKAIPPVELVGCWVKTSCEAAPATVNVALIPGDRPVAVAFRENAPCTPSVILQLPKVATPPLPTTGLVAQLSVPLPVLIVSKTELVALVTRLPEESSIHTTGCERKTAPPLDVPGEVLNTSCDAAPATVKGVLVPTTNVLVLSVALNLKVPCVPRAILQPLNLFTTPLRAVLVR